MLIPMLLPRRAGLTTVREPRSSPTSRVTRLGLAEPGPVAEPRRVDDRQPVAAHDVLEDDLVHGDRAGQDARSDVRDARQLEEALERSVLAVRPMDDEEGDVDRIRQGADGASRCDRVRRIGRLARRLVRPQAGDLLRRAGRPEQPGQRRSRLQERGRPVGQMPAALAVDVQQVRLEAIAIDGAEHGLGRRDADLVLGRATAGEDPDAHAGHERPSEGPSQAPTNSIS